MDLIRLGDWADKSEDKFDQVKDKRRVAVFFRKFGNGSERTSDFRVDLRWPDIEKLIIEFSAMGEPKAIALQQAKSLAVAAKRAGWGPPHSN